jgi:hypothetical protein
MRGRTRNIDLFPMKFDDIGFPIPMSVDSANSFAMARDNGNNYPTNNLINLN